MRKLIVSEFVSLDGVFEDPGGSEKTRYGGWSMKYNNDEFAKFKLDELSSSDTLLLGRITYEGFAAAWPNIKDDAGFADKMNNMKKYVVSKTLKKAEWKNSTIIGGDISGEVLKLKQQPGKNILIFGSGNLVTALTNQDLIDEYTLMMYPVVLGEGKRLFVDSDKKNLNLVETRTLKTGVILLRYELAR